jgi:hypothetical protein
MPSVQNIRQLSLEYGILFYLECELDIAKSYGELTFFYTLLL